MKIKNSDKLLYKDIYLDLYLYYNFFEGNAKINENIAKKILSIINNVNENSLIKTDNENKKDIKYPDWFCKENNEYYEIVSSDPSEFNKKFKYCNKNDTNFKVYSLEDCSKNIENAISIKIEKKYVSNISKTLFIYSTTFIPSFHLDIINEDKNIKLTFYENEEKQATKDIFKDNCIAYPNIYFFCKKFCSLLSKDGFNNIYLSMFIPEGKILLINIKDIDNKNFIKILKANEHSQIPYYKINKIENNSENKNNYFIKIIKTKEINN